MKLRCEAILKEFKLLRRLFLPHSTREYLALDDLVNRAPSDFPGPSEDEPTAMATEISRCAVLDDSLDETFDQGTGSSLAIAVEQLPATAAMD